MALGFGAAAFAQAPAPPAPVLGPGPATSTLPATNPPQTSPARVGLRESGADLCSMLPAGPLKTVGETTIEPITEVDAFERSLGYAAKCIKAYSQPRDLALGMTRFDRIENANRLLDKTGQHAQLDRRPAAYGDSGFEVWEQGKAEGTSRYYALVFRRGCHFFEGSDRIALGTMLPPQWEPVPAQTIALIRSTATSADARLRSMPPCGGAVPVVATSTTPSTVRVKDPATGSWVTWLLVPGAGLVLYGAAVLLGRTRQPQAGAGRAEPTAAGEPQELEPTEYELDIRTQDDRTRLATDGEDIVWIYAQLRCNKPEVPAAALTAGLEFATQGPDATWLTLGPAQLAHGFKSVPVRAWPPTPEARLADGSALVIVSATLEGQRVSGPVKLGLDAYVLEVLQPRR